MSCDPALLKHLEFPAVLKAIEEHYPSPIAGDFAEHLEPSLNPDEVSLRLSRARAWNFLFSRYLTPSFTRGIEDIRPLLARLPSGLLHGTDFVSLLKFFQHYEPFRTKISEIRKAGTLPEVLHELFSLPSFAEEKAELDRVFDDNGGIRESASPEIQAIFRERRRLERQFGAFVEQFLETQKDFLQDQIATQRRGRTVVLVRTDRFQSDRFLLYEPSASHASVYAEPVEFVQFNNQRQQLAFQLEQEIQRLLAHFSRLIASRQTDLHSAFEVLAEASFYGAVTQWAREVSATYPELNDKNIYHLVNARHPLFAPKCIPNHLFLGEGYSILILSGPNAGGKTVLLKTLGLLVVLALCGLPITADPGSSVSVPSAIFGVFAEDPGVLSTLSTFTSHLLALKTGLEFVATCPREVAEAALFLLDELGTGTDPDEGAAFAEAVLRWLQQKGPRVLISTHFPRLKVLKYHLSSVENAGLGYDLERFAPTYRLNYGVPGPSYGISVARRFGISEDIVADAALRLESPSFPVEQALARAQQELQEARRIREESEELARQMASRQAALDDRERHLERDLRERYLQRVRNAEALIRGWTTRAEELFKRLESEIKTARTVRESREALWDLYRSVRDWKEAEESSGSSSLSSSPPDAPGSKTPLKELFYPPLGQKVKVLTPEDAEGYVWVQVGETRLKVPSRSLREEPKPSATGVPGRPLPLPRSLDLRGKDADSAILTLDHFLNRAFAAGVNHLEIIHGKGTGKLREAVHEFLRGHSLVESFAIAPGNAGVTRVVLVSYSP